MPEKPATFRPAGHRSRSVVKAEADARRGSARARGYDARWDREAAAFKRLNPLCLGCSAIGRVTPTEVVDHVTPHRGDMAVFWDRAGWQPACRWHHDVVKQQLEARWARGELVAGDLRLDSPAATSLTRRLDPTG